MSPRKEMRKAARSTTATARRPKGFTDDEKAAMKERVEELKAEASGAKADILAKIAAMPEPDRTMGKRLHSIITTNAPDLTPTTWYGMPAYAKNGKVICFFQNAAKFKARYSTLGFSDKAQLDEGGMWPTSYALKDLTSAEEARIVALVKKAVR